MLAEERRKKIAELVGLNSIVQIQQLTDMFDVSVYTVRRDLSDLENKGLIKKTHGGAVKVEKTMWLPTVEDGKKEAYDEKKAIAHKAASYIEDGDTVFLMGSTIGLIAIQYICNKKITVATNSLDIARNLCTYDNIETIIIGGRIKNYKGNILGSLAAQEVQSFHFDKAIIPCAGVRCKSGVTTSTIDSADFTRTVINSAVEVLLAADYRKVGRVTFSKICDVSQIRRFITDDKADSHELNEISKKGVLIDVVKPSE